MRIFLLTGIGILFLAVPALPAEKRWYKGNTHTHTLWSDGNDFPEMVALWYRDNGYHFLVLSDHNILSRNVKSLKVSDVDRRSGGPAMAKAIERLGAERIHTRGEGENQLVRLWTLEEVKAYAETPEFILIEGEEISDGAQGKPIHTNAMNLGELIRPPGGATVREAMRNAITAVYEQAARLDRPILPHLNHPNYGWAVTAEDMAHVVEEEYFEVYNGAPIIRHTGDKLHPSVERMWDIANTIRVAELMRPPLYGLATDDSHHYFGLPGQTHPPGRGWIMVHAESLDAASLIRAVRFGDFYCSSGVTLSKLTYDGRTLSLDVEPRGDANYTIDFIGTLEGYDTDVEPRIDPRGNVITGQYSDDVGRVLKSVNGISATYTLTGKEFYVRALVTSDRPHTNPSFDAQLEQAWTQPVGWEKRIDPAVTKAHFHRGD